MKETLTGLPAASDRPCSISGMWRCLPTCSQVGSDTVFSGQLQVAALLLRYDGLQGGAGRSSGARLQEGGVALLWWRSLR